MIFVYLELFFVLVLLLWVFSHKVNKLKSNQREYRCVFIIWKEAF